MNFTLPRLFPRLKPQATSDQRPATSDTVMAFGKLPVYGDFIRHQASSRVVEAFDEWVQRGLYGMADEDHLVEAPIFAFVFSPRGEAHSLVGVLQPSRDRIGRRYPFWVAVEVRQEALDAVSVARLPVRWYGFFERAASLVREATSGQMTVDAVVAHLDNMTPPVWGASGDDGAYERYLHGAMFDDPRKALVLQNLTEVLLPIRGDVPEHFALGLRFPIGVDDVQTPFETSFWLDACMYLLDHPRLAPTFFRSMTAPSTSLSLFLRTPSGRVLTSLFTGSESDYICDLDRMGDSVEVVPEASPVSLDQLLERL